MAMEGGEVTITSGDNNQAAEAAEAAKVEAAQAELAAEEQAAEPDKILGRFESVDDLASAYQELQRAYNKGKADDDDEEDEPEASADEDDEDQSDEQEEADDDDEDEGISEQDAQAMQEALFAAAGGEDKYRNLQEWAATNMQDKTKAAWNEAIERGDVGGLEAMLKGVMWDMQQDRGYEPKLGGGRTPTSDAKPFNSEAEVVEMMNDPRYRDPGRRDPSFVREVERRIAMSDVFNSASS